MQGCDRPKWGIGAGGLPGPGGLLPSDPMKTSLAWLNSYLDKPMTADQAEPLLTGVGFPFDGRDELTLSTGASDTLLDVEVTSNRSDCLSHLGLAREAAAAYGRSLVHPEIGSPGGTGSSVDELTGVESSEPDLCPLYTARVVTGVKIGPSPKWLIERIEGAGLRSVNNVVDITNFVLLELGQPLHAFDMDKLAGRRIVVRRALGGEQFTAIDGSRHELTGKMLVIADAQKPVAIAGVMGGLDSEVTETTTDILLESAIFDPLSVRSTSRALKLASDSSFRFERGVDPLGVDRASRRAAQLIVELAGGTLAKGVIRVGQNDPAPVKVTMRISRCRALLGIGLDAEQISASLKRLGLSPKTDGDTVTCTIPTFRLDLKREADLIEEVGRLYGYDNIEIKPRLELEVRPKQSDITARQELGRVLVAHGYHETVTPSLLTREHAQAFCPGELKPMALAGETRRQDRFLRPSLLPSLLNCRKHNQDRGNEGVRLFEVAGTWGDEGGNIGGNTGGNTGGGTREVTSLAILTDAPDPHEGFRAARGAIEELTVTLGGEEAAKSLAFEPVQDDKLNPAAKVMLHGEERGRIGVLCDALLSQFGLQTPVVLAEIDYDPLVANYPPKRTVGDLPRFPGIERDLSIVVDEAVTWRQVEQCVAQTAPKMLEALQFLTIFRGKQIGKGKKSLSLRMRFRNPDATLRHDEVDPQVNAVVEKLKQGVAAELRG
jgi:phenylalanyl-tRNA synthetase beta chain